MDNVGGRADDARILFCGLAPVGEVSLGVFIRILPFVFGGMVSADNGFRLHLDVLGVIKGRQLMMDIALFFVD